MLEIRYAGHSFSCKICGTLFTGRQYRSIIRHLQKLNTCKKSNVKKLTYLLPRVFSAIFFVIFPIRLISDGLYQSHSAIRTFLYTHLVTERIQFDIRYKDNRFDCQKQNKKSLWHNLILHARIYLLKYEMSVLKETQISLWNTIRQQ